MNPILQTLQACSEPLGMPVYGPKGAGERTVCNPHKYVQPASLAWLTPEDEAIWTEIIKRQTARAWSSSLVSLLRDAEIMREWTADRGIGLAPYSSAFLDASDDRVSPTMTLYKLRWETQWEIEWNIGGLPIRRPIGTPWTATLREILADNPDLGLDEIRALVGLPRGGSITLGGGAAAAVIVTRL